MDRSYVVHTRITRPIADVYDAIVSAERLTRYFAERASGDLRVGDRVRWHWDEWGDFPVTVTALERPHRIVLTLDSRAWAKTTDDAYTVEVRFELETLDDGATKVSISETGWRTDAAGLTASHENCSGWTHMALCLKAHLEHGIDLR